MYRSFKAVAYSRIGGAMPLLALFGLWAALLPQLPAARVLVWWTILCAVSLFNILAWRLCAEVLWRDVDPDAYRFQRRQVSLSAVFILGCAFRSLLPRADVQRLGLFDTWLSSVLVGRSVATIAELCFAAQWALWLHYQSKEANCRLGVAVSRLIVPLIAVAEVYSWCAILTTCYLGNVIEESIWATSVFLVVLGAVALRRQGVGRRFVKGVILCGMIYVLYMCLVDVPMYASRWLADEADGKVYSTLSQGLTDVSSRWTITHAWEHWKPEIGWMTLYFSVGVWSSLALVRLPRLASDRARPEAVVVSSSGAAN